jgi:hypothetical protein
VSVERAAITIETTIIAFNGGGAMLCSEAQAACGCVDSYSNQGGNDLCGDDLGGRFQEDPLFCDHDNYELSEGSPCLPGHEHGGIDCGLVGGCGEGCGATLDGACCLPAGGACAVLDEERCEAYGGVYQGDETSCDPNPCQPTPTKATTWGRIKAGFR